MIARFSIFFIFYLLQRYLPVSAADFPPAVLVACGMSEALAACGMSAVLMQTDVLSCSFLQAAATKDAAAFEPEALRCETARNVLMRMCAPAASLQKKESGKPGHNAR